MKKYIVAGMMGALMFGGIVPAQAIKPEDNPAFRPVNRTTGPPILPGDIPIAADSVSKKKKKKKKKKYYKNCTQARKAGVTPLKRGQRGYSKRLDRDRDGIACE